MSASPPASASEFIHCSWAQFEPCYLDLASNHLNAANLTAWLTEWTHLRRLWYEIQQRLYVAVTTNTANPESQQQYRYFLDHVYPHIQSAEQTLKQKLLASGLQPPGFEVSLRNMRCESTLFHPANLPLLSEEFRLNAEYDRIIGAQTVEWQGKELTLAELTPFLHHPDRQVREHAWRLAAARQLADRSAINQLWIRLMEIRRLLAANVGLPDYREYRWRQLLRFDYTSQDCLRFHRAIETVVLPAAQRLYEKRRQRLGLPTLRPWDLEVDPFGRPPLRPFDSVAELTEKAAGIFQRLEPHFGEYFEIMRRESLLDLESRKDKAPGGYCTSFPIARRSFIFANSAGLHDDVMTLFHECGHAFHDFESFALPYHWPPQMPMEFAEVASLAMELLASPYLSRERGGFYSPEDAARALAEHLERELLFWPYMAVVDAFQHWAYEHHRAAADPARCDAHWRQLWQHYMPGVDWSGLEDELSTGWQRKLHIIQSPFYYVEYGLAQLAAVQIWRNSLDDQAGAVSAYRLALALGETLPLPELYAAAGARFAFDAATLRREVAAMEAYIARLEGA